jgi:hypothetical protein
LDSEIASYQGKSIEIPLAVNCASRVVHAIKVKLIRFTISSQYATHYLAVSEVFEEAQDASFFFHHAGSRIDDECYDFRSIPVF